MYIVYIYIYAYVFSQYIQRVSDGTCDSRLDALESMCHPIASDSSANKSGNEKIVFVQENQRYAQCQQYLLNTRYIQTFEKLGTNRV